MPKDFSDINEKLLIDIVPQNKLVLTKDLNGADVLIKNKAGNNIIKLPKTDYDNYILFDKDGKKIKVSRKTIEKDCQDNNCEFIEIKDDENKNEIIDVAEFTKALKEAGQLGGYQIRFLVGGNEERGSLCMEHYFKTLKKGSYFIFPFREFIINIVPIYSCFFHKLH